MRGATASSLSRTWVVPCSSTHNAFLPLTRSLDPVQAPDFGESSATQDEAGQRPSARIRGTRSAIKDASLRFARACAMRHLWTLLLCGAAAPAVADDTSWAEQRSCSGCRKYRHRRKSGVVRRAERPAATAIWTTGPSRSMQMAVSCTASRDCSFSVIALQQWPQHWRTE